jgi:hypothetical protein
MWIFDNPKSYPDMLKKVATVVFFIAAIGLFILTQISNIFSSFFANISWNVKYDIGGFSLYLANIYIPILIAVFENMFKLHDRISDIFAIRYRFDKKVIIWSLLNKLGMNNMYIRVNRKNREKIMDDIFYKYVGYANPKIDPHLVYMAMGAWSWYWIVLDTVVVIIFTIGVSTIFYFSWKIVLVSIVMIFILLIISHLIKHFQCKRYAEQEIDAILMLDNAKLDIETCLVNDL